MRAEAEASGYLEAKTPMRQTLMRARGLGLVLLGLMMVAAPVGWAQDFSFGGQPAAKKGHVTYESDGMEVAAGRPQVVELMFRVDDGFHINSHTPKDALLIPTVLKLDSGAAVKVLSEEYPQGTTFKLGQGTDAETLNVYQGEFRVRVSVVAAKGAQTLTGTLHYQACDDAACFPPRTLAVNAAVTGK